MEVNGYLTLKFNIFIKIELNFPIRYLSKIREISEI